MATVIVESEPSNVSSVESESFKPVSMFISYAWDGRQQCVRAMVKFLQTVRRCKVYLDTDKLFNGEFAIVEAFPKNGIESSDVVILFCSESYKQSPYCRRAAIYALQLGKLLVPVLMDKELKIDGWLETITAGNRNFVDFAPDKRFEEVADNLLLQIAKRLKARGPTPQPVDQARLEKLKQAVASDDHEEPPATEANNENDGSNREKTGTFVTRGSTLISSFNPTMTPQVTMTPNSEGIKKLSADCKPINLFVSHSPTGARAHDVHSIIAFLESNNFKVWLERESTTPDDSARQLAMQQADLAVFCLDQKIEAWPGCKADYERASFLAKKLLFIRIDDSQPSWLNTLPEAIKAKMTGKVRQSSEFHLGNRPMSVIIDEMLEHMSALLTVKLNIPRPLAGYHNRLEDEEHLKSQLENLFRLPGPSFLTVRGESGVGKTVLLAQFLGDKANNKFLSFDCRVQYVAWVNVARCARKRAAGGGSAVGGEEQLLVDLLVDVFEPEFKPSRRPATFFNFATLFASEKRNQGRLLIVFDDVGKNDDAMLALIAKLGPSVRAIAIMRDDAGPSRFDDQFSIATMTVNLMAERQLHRMLMSALDWQIGKTELADVSKLCSGLPLIAKLFELHLVNKLSSFTSKSDRALMQLEASTYCDALCQRLMEGYHLNAAQNFGQQQNQRLLGIKKTVTSLLQMSFEKQAGSGEQAKMDVSSLNAFFAFLCFAPGEPVDVRDLAVMWSCDETSAERLLNAFWNKGLVYAAEQLDGVVKSYSVNELIYRATLDIAKTRRQLANSGLELFSKLVTVEMAAAAVKLRRKPLLTMICADLDAATLERICRTPRLEQEGEHEDDRPLLQLLFSQAWRVCEGTHFERNVSCELLAMFIDKLTAAKVGVNVIEILSMCDRTGDCAFLQIDAAAGKDPTPDYAKVRRQIDTIFASSLASPSGRQLVKEALLDRRRWVSEARDRNTSKLLVAAIRCEETIVQYSVQALSKQRQDMAQRMGAGKQQQQPNRAVVDLTNKNGDTPLMASCANGHLRIVELLLAYGGDVNARNDDDWTPLMFAAHSGHHLIVETLLSIVIRGPDVNAVEKKYGGMTALMLAARAGHRRVVDALRRQPSLNCNATSFSNGSTALMMAAQKGHADIVEQLALMGADPKAANSDGVTALMLAAENGHSETVKFLEIFGCGDLDVTRHDGMTALMLAAQHGYDDIVDYLRLNGAAVSLTSSTGRNAFMLAAQNGHRKVVEALRALISDVDLTDSTPREATALLLAAENGHCETVRLLIAIGADVNVRDRSNGASALALAARGGYLETVELLRLHGAGSGRHVSSVDVALRLAAENGQERVVEFLAKEVGASLRARGGTMPTWTALMYAAANGYDSVVRYLADVGTEVTMADVSELIAASTDQETVRFLSSIAIITPTNNNAGSQQDEQQADNVEDLILSAARASAKVNTKKLNQKRVRVVVP